MAKLGGDEKGALKSEINWYTIYDIEVSVWGNWDLRGREASVASRGFGDDAATA